MYNLASVWPGSGRAFETLYWVIPTVQTFETNLYTIYHVPLHHFQSQTISEEIHSISTNTFHLAIFKNIYMLGYITYKSSGGKATCSKHMQYLFSTSNSFHIFF